MDFIPVNYNNTLQYIPTRTVSSWNQSGGGGSEGGFNAKMYLNSTVSQTYYNLLSDSYNDFRPLHSLGSTMTLTFADILISETEPAINTGTGVASFTDIFSINPTSGTWAFEWGYTDYSDTGTWTGGGPTANIDWSDVGAGVKQASITWSASTYTIPADKMPVMKSVNTFDATSGDATLMVKCVYD